MNCTEATPDLVRRLIARMGTFDAELLSELMNEDSVVMLANKSQMTWCWQRNGAPICVGGVMVDAVGTGIPWMIAAPDVARNRREFLLMCEIQFERVQDLFPRLWTCVDSRYPKSIRVLEWLGFVVDPPQVMKIGQSSIMAYSVKWSRA